MPGLGDYLLSNVLKSGAVRYADREAIYCSGTGHRLSYRELDERANRLANALLAHGFHKGEVIGFLCSNRAEIAEIYFALAKGGLVGVPLNYRLRPAEIAATLCATEASGFICEVRFDSAIPTVRRDAPKVRDIICVGDSPNHACLMYEPLLSAAAADEPDVQLSDSDPCYVSLTSGTTGVPKSYVVSHFTASGAARGMLEFEVAQDDVILVVLPVFGRAGFAWICHALARGLRMVLADFQAEAILRLIDTERVTYTMLVPTMSTMLMDSPERVGHDLRSLRMLAFVGAPLPETVRERSQALLCANLCEGYGLQETGWLTVSTPANRERKPDSVGQPVLFVDIRILDEGQSPVRLGTIGEIVARSPLAATAYLDGPTRSAEAFRDKWFHTGDLGRFDEDGFLYVCGRLKDMIVSGGQNVYSAEVESVLLKVPGVRDCAVIGLPDDTWGERVVAVIVTEDPIDHDHIQKFCRPLIAGFKIPREVNVQREPLPRTPTGKVQKFKLVERYGSRDARGGEWRLE